MKTNTFEHSFRILFLCSSLFLVSCQKDEFYQKDYLENPFAPDTQVDGGATGGSTVGGTDGASVGGAVGTTTGGSTVGGTDGSSTGGSSTGGSTVGGTDGSTTGGSTVGGTTGSTTGGSTVGGTDGSTTGGSTVGGTDGSTTGGSTVGGTTGSTTGGSTVGGTDGSSTGGSTGGSTTGSTAGGSTGGSNQQGQDSFQQTSASQKKLDIVWVIDNSGSMGDEQASLATNFDLFIRDFITKNVDFKMGITTTDTTNSGGGQAYGNSLSVLTSAAAQANENQFFSDFQRLVQVGTRGSGNEKGLMASESFLNRYENSWMRSDAYLVVVYLSDEEDQSPKAKEEYLARLQQAKAAQGAGYVKAYSIVNTQPCQSANGITCGFERYAYQANQTGGTVSDIKENFASVLDEMGQSIINLLDTFPLSHDPIPGSIVVKVNGVVQASGWSVTGRQLKFDAGSVPAVGSSIQVSYEY
ncbi:MAG: VWA domain-containing protein [Bacteriovoracaceae bacterium]|nr:VWA domain-containing protein [Bacteriovoracaceae bacterium]